jgi:hypothetical protein
MGRKKISGRFENISTASLRFVAGKQVLVAKELIEAASVNDRLYDGVFHRVLGRNSARPVRNRAVTKRERW